MFLKLKSIFKKMMNIFIIIKNNSKNRLKKVRVLPYPFFSKMIIFHIFQWKYMKKKFKINFEKNQKKSSYEQSKEKGVFSKLDGKRTR